jgi:hypothetical protein
MATSRDPALTRLHAGFIPPIELDFGSATPLYRQICMWFQRSILCGQLRRGQPSQCVGQGTEDLQDPGAERV